MNLTDDIQEADVRIMLADHGEPIEWTQAALSGSPFELTAIVDRGPPHRVPHDRGPEPLVDLFVNILIADLPTGWNSETARIEYNNTSYRPVATHREAHVVTLECRQL